MESNTSSPADLEDRWQALGDADRVRPALADLRASLVDPLPAWVPAGTSDAERAAFDVSLASGAAGQALFHAEAAAASGDGAELERARRCLSLAGEAVARVPMDADLFSGFSGIAWTLAHLERLPGGETAGEEDPLAGIDAALLGMLDHETLPRHFDLVNGLTGLGVYALERLPRRSARPLLARIVRRLEDRAEIVPGGRAWRTPPEFADPERGHGPFDLGMAHGAAGVIVMLAAACAWDVEADRASRLLAAAGGALLAGRLEGREGIFPATTGEGARREPARLAWCYGDAGIAVALGTAADVTRDAALAATAREIGRAAAERTFASSGVRDAGLCHGAAGLAHVFHRLHHATHEARFAEAARVWLARALDFHREGEPFGGFTSAVVDRDGTLSAAADPGFLRGAAGVGLALLATTGREPAWDRALLLTIRRP